MTLSEIRELFGAVRPVLLRALRSGQLLRPQATLTEPDPDVQVEVDVRIPRADGSDVTATIHRSKRADAAGAPCPAILCAHPYDNRLTPALGNTPLGGPPQQYRMIPQEGRGPRFSTLTSWEAPDPDRWVRAGYAVVNVNMPGYATSGGHPTLFAPDQTEAYGEAIDWVGAQSWCNGKVGLAGVSYLAISQYGVAARQGATGTPSALAAICPWEGVSDLLDDLFRDGGVAEEGFPVFWWHTEVKPTIACSEAEFVARNGFLPMEIDAHHPFRDDYWNDRTANLEEIEVPMLVCASFSDQGLHTRGSFRAFRNASSEHKWVYTHRGLKWDAFYSDAAFERMRAFFDCFLKGERENGALGEAPVRLEVRSARDRIHEVRGEHEWPLARTQARKLYPTADGRLVEAPPPHAVTLAIDARHGRLAFRHRFAEPTELTGPMVLHLDVGVRPHAPGATPPDDMVLFAVVDKLDRAGERVPFYGSVGNHEDAVARGQIQVSRRALDPARSTEWEPVPLNTHEAPLVPGEIATIDVSILPSSTFFEAGEGIELILSPNEIVPSPPFKKRNVANRGFHLFHLGEGRDGHLRIPVIPRASSTAP